MNAPVSFAAPGGPGELPARPWTWRHSAAVFALALVPRLAHYWFVRATPLASDFIPDLAPYLFAVQRIMDSRFFFVEPMVMSPGHALVLATQYILAGPDVPLFVLVNAVLDAGSAALCGVLAARIAPAGLERRAGLVAGCLYALCGPLLFYALLPLGEGPAMFLSLTGLVLLFGPRPGEPSSWFSARLPAWLPAWLSGACLALAALTRPNLAPGFLLGLCVWALANIRAQGWRAPAAGLAGRCLLGFLLALSPFMAHNAAVSGRASPFGFQGGYTLYSGNHHGATGVGDALPGFDNTPYLVLLQAWARAETDTGRELSLAQADAYWYGRTSAFFAGHPGEAARLLGRKALLLFNAGGVDATANQDFCARFSPVPNLLALPLGLVWALAVPGLWRTRRDPRAAALAAMLLAQAAVVVLFQVTPRYRVVLLPLWLCFAGLGLADLPGLLRGGRRALAPLAVWAPLVVGALLLAVSFTPLRLLVDKPGLAGLEHARLARYYLIKGPQALAPAEFLAALALGAPDQERLRAELAASLRMPGVAERLNSP